MKKKPQHPVHLLGVKIPEPLREAMDEKEASTGLSKSHQTRLALMAWLGVKDLRDPVEPYVPPTKEVTATESV